MCQLLGEGQGSETHLHAFSVRGETEYPEAASPLTASPRSAPKAPSTLAQIIPGTAANCIAVCRRRRDPVRTEHPRGRHDAFLRPCSDPPTVLALPGLPGSQKATPASVLIPECPVFGSRALVQVLDQETLHRMVVSSVASKHFPVQSCGTTLRIFARAPGESGRAGG